MDQVQRVQTSSNQPSCPAAPGSSTTQLSLGSSSTQLLLAPARLLLVPLYQPPATDSFIPVSWCWFLYYPAVPGSSTTKLLLFPLQAAATGSSTPPAATGSFTTPAATGSSKPPLPPAATGSSTQAVTNHAAALVSRPSQLLLVPIPASCFWFLYQLLLVPLPASCSNHPTATGSFTSCFCRVPLPAATGSSSSCYWFLYQLLLVPLLLSCLVACSK